MPGTQRQATRLSTLSSGGANGQAGSSCRQDGRQAHTESRESGGLGEKGPSGPILAGGFASRTSRFSGRPFRSRSLSVYCCHTRSSSSPPLGSNNWRRSGPRQSTATSEPSDAQTVNNEILCRVWVEKGSHISQHSSWHVHHAEWTHPHVFWLHAAACSRAPEIMRHDAVAQLS